MKLKNNKIFGWMILSLLLLLSSCRDDTFNEYWDNSDEFTVTINVELEGMESTTRAGATRTPQIGNGSQIDMLVYAVYYDKATDRDDPDHIPQWEAATEYVKTYETGKEPFGGAVTPGYGQTIVNVSETLGEGEKHPITLTLKKGQEYRIVFWAQNHETEAFVIDDLKRVQMKYKVLEEEITKEPVVDENGEETGEFTESSHDNIKSKNNDEKRDAFCRSFALSGNQPNRNLTIYLRRPLAQINVGTRGFDFESITRNAAKGEKYLYSKIRINRAARYLNVVTDEVYTTTTEIDDSQTSTEAFYTIDYEYDKIPAYWRMEVPEFPSYTIYDLENDIDENGIQNPNSGFQAFREVHSKDFFKDITDPGAQEKKFRETYGKEEFLRVHLSKQNDKDYYVPYSSMGASLQNKEDDDSEVFKYLSMCYVLTNSSDEYQDVLTNVKVWIAKDENGTDEVEIANIKNVPVQRNHRTNVVGSLLTANASMEIIIDQDFSGRKVYGDDEVMSGEIAEGFYYDAKNQEFQISSVNGLLFFQQLVNGDLTVRQYSNPTPTGLELQGLYPYKKYGGDDDNIYWLQYKSWTRKELGKKKADLLMKALKLDGLQKGADNTQNGINYGVKYSNQRSDNSYIYEIKDALGQKCKMNVLLRQYINDEDGEDEDGGLWPFFNNFSFFGATVKLMADIDLSGIEWIPIGFDCANWDSSIGSVQGYQTTNQVNTTNYHSLLTGTSINFDHRRVFAGTFDGNGHTIYNLTTKRFGSEVLDYNQQQPGTKTNSNKKDGPYDNFQWFGRGLFGLCGPNVEIKNLRLQNVDVHGNNGVAAIVAIINSPRFTAKIDNCIVDGGYVTGVPMYRHDLDDNDSRYYGRTHARGVYVSGIVGQICAYGDDAGVTNCEVRNLIIQGFRRVGGIIGSIADQGDASMGNADMQLDITVKDNYVRNTKIICNQYVPFNYIWNHEDTGIWKNGFGWGAGSATSPMSDKIVGGNLDTVDAFSLSYKSGKSKTEFYESYIPGNNKATNVQYSIISVRPNETGESSLTHATMNTVRESQIENIPLEFIPMFSSLFVDEVDLTDNYYGKAQLKTKIDFTTDAQIWRGPTAKNSNGEFFSFTFPYEFPNGDQVNYRGASEAKAGMYVETVYISGEHAPGGRSVVTPQNVDGVNSCVMYVTARDMKQFEEHINGKGTTSKTMPGVTNIRNMVLRGAPYAWAGMILAPNCNMNEVNIDNVTVYDVYQTLALEEKRENPAKDIIQNYTCLKKYYYNDKDEFKVGTTDNSDPTARIILNVSNSNLRGYTKPGDVWGAVNYTKTTFEPGSETRYSYSTMEKKNENGNTVYDEKNNPVLDDRHNEFRTVKVEGTQTNFTDCFFKAPFYIDLSPVVTENSKTVNFSNCYATSAYNNVRINLNNKQYNGHPVYYIAIDKNTQSGKTEVTYYGVKDKKQYKIATVAD